MAEQLIGKVAHYWGNINVAGIEITDGELNVGETIHISGMTTDFTQEVASMQIDKESVEKAKAGMSVGIKVAERVRSHDSVFKIVP